MRRPPLADCTSPLLPLGVLTACLTVWLLGSLTAERLAAATGRDQTQEQQAGRDSRLFRSGIEVTRITATVTDKDGHLITGLPREDFDVYEDGVRQTVTQFTGDRVPIGLGVLLDISDSMYGKRIKDARTAVDRFLFELLDASDEFFVMAFNHRARPLTGWTRDRDDVTKALEGLRPSGGTAIYDAIISALPLIDHRTRARAALLVISDGADTASTATLREIRTALLRSDAFVYAVAIDSPDPQPINTRVNAQALREITAESGGRTEIVRTSADLDEATASIAEELNSQYVLGYTSPRGADGQYHSIRVRTHNQDYRVRSRNGYVATPRNTSQQ
ncbi:MAG TPA: VWA domain-containing protein [Vicinamibacterales bacterium]|nr:VWA domain-containing protein [Vicinamibacterales bacterium]